LIEIDDRALHGREAAGFGAQLQRAMARWIPLLDVSPITISFQKLEPGLDEAWAYIQRVVPDRTP